MEFVEFNIRVGVPVFDTFKFPPLTSSLSLGVLKLFPIPTFPVDFITSSVIPPGFLNIAKSCEFAPPCTDNPVF